ncbi:MAG: hypothetical protein K0S27_1357 [Gammaproteobacteria bacterium]|nr:hypothetical protein [Gammaproteobacteria bacterium]
MLKKIQEKNINNKNNRLYNSKNKEKEIITFDVAVSRYNGKLFAVTIQDKKLFLSNTNKYFANDTEEDLKKLKEAIQLELSLQFLGLSLSKDVSIREQRNENLRKQINKACNSKILK